MNLDELNVRLGVATALVWVSLIATVVLIILGIVCSTKKKTKAPWLFFVGAVFSLVCAFLLFGWKNDVKMSIDVQKWFYEDTGGESITEFSEEFEDYCDEIIDNAKGG